MAIDMDTTTETKEKEPYIIDQLTVSKTISLKNSIDHIKFNFFFHLIIPTRSFWTHSLFFLDLGWIFWD